MITLAKKRLAKQGKKIGIVSASWGRSRIVESVMEYYSNLKFGGMEVVRIMAVSPEDPDPIGEVEGWQKVEVENDPLGKKFNAASAAAFEQGVSGIIVIGSDDVLSLPYLNFIAERAKENYDFVRPNEMCIYKPGSDRVSVCLSAPPGAGRYLSRDLVHRMGGKPWDDSANSYLDQSMQSRMRDVQIRSYQLKGMLSHGFIVLDIKTDGNMWDLALDEGGIGLKNNLSDEFLYLRRVITYPVERFMAQHFPTFDYKSL